ncbi:hypothetical protein BT69DRAFT_1213412, partial [Atractiella rhizophila]
DEQICSDYLSSGQCPRGSACPKRHILAPSPLNFTPPPPVNPSAHARTVCKHWLRGLCKKGATCEFLHEYNLRKMPECWFFAKYGYCSNGDECMYLHVDEQMRRSECPKYRLGFCSDGPTCPLKHVRRPLCPGYLTGFCPQGPNCPMGHPKANLEPPPPFRAGMFGLSAPQGYDGTNRGLGHSGNEGFGGGGGGGGGGDGQPKRRLRNTDDVTCFKVRFEPLHFIGG